MSIKDSIKSILKVDKLVYEYKQLDEEGNVEGVNRAIDEVELDVNRGDFVAIL